MSIELIVGPMCSGKSEKLQKELTRAQYKRQTFQLFNPAVNSRDSDGNVHTRDGRSMSAIQVASPQEIYEHYVKSPTAIVAIEEVQFFNKDHEIAKIVGLARWLSECRKARVLIAGLDLDFRREPFGPMPQLLTYANEVDKLTAICVECGEDARFTQRLVNGRPAHWDDPIILVGDAEEGYVARCGECHIVEGVPYGIIYDGFPFETPHHAQDKG